MTPHAETTAGDIVEALTALRNEERAAAQQRYFKTGKGEYGEGDRFLGIPNPQVRKVAGAAWRTTPMNEVARLARSPWHEARLCALLLLAKAMQQADKRGDDAASQHVFRLYLSLHPHINNWDLVDCSAPVVCGLWECAHPQDATLDNWADSPHSTLWQRRIAMVSTYALCRVGHYAALTRRAAALMATHEDLLHKAAGWMLREMGQHGGMAALLAFLEAHAPEMPSVMLRYAIEKLPPDDRRHWLARRKGKGGCLQDAEETN